MMVDVDDRNVSFYIFTNENPIFEILDYQIEETRKNILDGIKNAT